MLEDTFESLDPDADELEEEAQEEVDKVLWELTEGKLGEAPSAVTDTLKEEEPAGPSRVAGVEEDDNELEEMQSRLEALRS